MAAAKKSKSIRSASRPNSIAGRIFGLIFGLIFFSAGALFFWLAGLSPIVKSISSKSWIESNCVILSSEVGVHSDSDGTTYSVDISFSYTFDGRDYTSDRYGFSKMSSSGRSGKEKVVAEYPVGAERICWIDPRNPSQAVLHRGIPGIVYFMIPFSSVFIIIGLAVALASIGLYPKSWKANFNNDHIPVTTEASGSATLKPDVSGLGKVFGTLFAACFWNGITSVFVVIAVKSHLRGDPEWFLTIFIIPFVLIGLGLIGAVIHSLLALANPRLELTLSETSPRLGDTVDLDWRANKPLHRLRKLTITLLGQEAATYRRGTDSATDHSIFHQEVLQELDQPVSEQQGNFSLTIPIDSMHTFDSGNNEIEWLIKVEGDIPRYPDISDSYPITVRPIAETRKGSEE